MRAYSVNDPVHGLATAISPSMRITRNTMMPQIAHVMTAPGPAWLMIPLSPTKKPAPMDAAHGKHGQVTLLQACLERRMNAGGFGCFGAAVGHLGSAPIA